MRVQAPNGRWYQRDHPHEIISPHVMRFEEIRHWLRELSTNPEYGWANGGVPGLERALGMGKKTLKDKLGVQWIWPGEQIRLTARIRDILEGRVVPRRFDRGNQKPRVDGVYVDPPQPPKVSKPRVVKIKVQIGKLQMIAGDAKSDNTLPQFRNAFQNVPTWKGG